MTSTIMEKNVCWVFNSLAQRELGYYHKKGIYVTSFRGFVYNILQGSLRKHILISNSIQSPLNFYFRFILVFQKTHSFTQSLIFRASELPQRPNFDAFQEMLICNLVSSTNLEPKVVPPEAGQYLCRSYTFFTKI